MVVLYMDLRAVLTYRCWTLYKIMHFVYVLVLIEPLYRLAHVHLQTNHLSMYEEENSQYSVRIPHIG